MATRGHQCCRDGQLRALQGIDSFILVVKNRNLGIMYRGVQLLILLYFIW
uniref:Uncharacterized protein n=1 Tax=Terrapene triunguis TaxID=2587831 RepID=A0A674I8T6_9SAUR